MTEEIHKIVITGDDASARRAFRNIRQGAQSLKTDLTSVGRSTDSLNVSFRDLVKTGASLLGVRLGASLVRDAVQLADTWTLVDARIRNSTRGQQAYQQASKELLEIAKRTNTEFESVATLFTRTNKFIEENGGNQQDTLRLVELVAQAAKVSGAGVQEQQASVRQLSQALASGVLRGDEFNSVMENSPRLAQALADGIGVPIGALRAMAEQGQLTADVVTDALLGQAGKIAAEFAAIPLTVGASMTNLTTAAGEFVSEFDKANGVTRGLAEGINDLAKNLPGLAETFKQLIALGLPAYMIRLALSVDLAAVAFSKLILPAAAIFGAAKVLELLTAINTERLRQQQLQNNGAAERAQLVATEHLLDVQVQSLAQYKEMSATAQEFYVKDLNQALEVARLKLKVNAGTNEQLAREGARQARIYSQALAEIATADGNRAQAMKLHSNNVVVAKEMELARLNAVFKAQKQGLKEAEQAFEEARKKRAEVVKEFSDLRDEIGAKPQGEILGFELEKAVEDARKAQEAAAKAPAAEAGKLADTALEKARAAGELLKAYKEQENATGSSIDSAAAETLTKQLADRLVGIADAAAGVQEQIAADQLAILQKSIQDTLNQAEALKDLSVSFDQEGAIKSLDEIMALIREKAQASPINIPVQIVTGSLPESVNEPINTGVTDSQGRIVYRAGGGMVFGPGGPTGDKIHAMLSDREYVIRAAAVKRYGVRYLDALNNMRLPKFANGGAVSRAAIPSLSSASLSSSGGPNTTINLTLPGMGTYRLHAAKDIANSLQRDLSLESLKYGSPK
jgi:tape measure domain-containing protein